MTVYGIETIQTLPIRHILLENKLQQHLPFTVLKRERGCSSCSYCILLQQHLPFTVLKLSIPSLDIAIEVCYVATVPTVYGIETRRTQYPFHGQCVSLQQHLPFTVLKHSISDVIVNISILLQQHLPFTVLKRFCMGHNVLNV